MLRELLSDVVPGEETERELKWLTAISASTKEMHGRLQDLIIRLGDANELITSEKPSF